MISLRESLRKIGEPRQDRTTLSLQRDFKSIPTSLRAAMKAMNPPLIQSWSQTKTSEHDNQDWTEECQGLTTDGQYWYVISNNEKDANCTYDEFGEVKEILSHQHKGIYKFTLNFEPIGFLQYPRYNHIGAPSYFEGKIYVPIEGPRSIWVVNTNLVDEGIFELGKNEHGEFLQGNLAWCAINPWNGHLYSSIFGDTEGEHKGDVKRLFAYELPNLAYKKEKDILLQGDTIHRVQGGCFSKHGHVYLSCDTVVYELGHIHAYSGLNGAYLGSYELNYDEDMEFGEVEGLSVNHIVHNDGIATDVHLVVLDNDGLGSPDDVYLYHFSVPDPNVL